MASSLTLEYLGGMRAFLALDSTAPVKLAATVLVHLHHAARHTQAARLAQHRAAARLLRRRHGGASPRAGGHTPPALHQRRAILPTGVASWRQEHKVTRPDGGTFIIASGSQATAAASGVVHDATVVRGGDGGRRERQTQDTVVTLHVHGLRELTLEQRPHVAEWRQLVPTGACGTAA